MEISSANILRIVVGVVLVATALSLFGVEWKVRIRILAAMLIGVLFIGIMGWPLVRPADPVMPVTMSNGNISFVDVIICIFLAFASGFAAFFVCAPYGFQAAALAVPSGLSVWALNPGNMAALIRLNYTLQQRQALYAALRWEGLLWLALIAAGYLGAVTGRLLRAEKKSDDFLTTGSGLNLNKAATSLTSIVATVVIAQFAIGIFAQDVRMFDSDMGSVVGQPGIRQTAFAVFIAFCIAGFVTRKFLKTGFVYCLTAAAILSFYALSIAAKEDVLDHVVRNWPVVFFPRAMCAVLPIQILAFAGLGSVAGYWLALRAAESTHHITTGPINQKKS